MNRLNLAATNSGNTMTGAYDSPNSAAKCRRTEHSKSSLRGFRGLFLTLMVVCFSCTLGMQELKAQDNKFTFTEDFKPSGSNGAVYSGTVSALKTALKTNPLGGRSLVHHSDRGVQYCSYEYVNILKKNAIEISMTEVNHCYEIPFLTAATA